MKTFVAPMKRPSGPVRIDATLATCQLATQDLAQPIGHSRTTSSALASIIWMDIPQDLIDVGTTSSPRGLVTI